MGMVEVLGSPTRLWERKEESQPTQAATRRRLYLHDKDLCGTLPVKVLEVIGTSVLSEG